MQEYAAITHTEQLIITCYFSYPLDAFKASKPQRTAALGTD